MGIITIQQYKYFTGKSKVNFKELIFLLLFRNTFAMHISLYKFINSNNILHKLIIRNKLHRKYGVIVSLNCKIGKNVRFMHPLGIVIGDGVVIGDNCVIYHNVTIGQRNAGYPRIGNNVTIYAGAVVIGDIKVGDNAIIGANAVVIHDVSENAKVAGIPAKELN